MSAWLATFWRARRLWVEGEARLAGVTHAAASGQEWTAVLLALYYRYAMQGFSLWPGSEITADDVYRSLVDELNKPFPILAPQPPRLRLRPGT